MAVEKKVRPWMGLVVILAIGAFIFYEFTSGRSHRKALGGRRVSVTFVNNSGQDVKQIELRHEKGTIEKIITLKPGEEYAINFESPGENAYIARVTLSDDKVLRSPEVYVEGGYCMTETISRDSIRSKSSSY